jgi:hypothetical protein
MPGSPRFDRGAAPSFTGEGEGWAQRPLPSHRSQCQARSVPKAPSSPRGEKKKNADVFLPVKTPNTVCGVPCSFRGAAFRICTRSPGRCRASANHTAFCHTVSATKGPRPHLHAAVVGGRGRTLQPGHACVLLTWFSTPTAAIAPFRTTRARAGSRAAATRVADRANPGGRCASTTARSRPGAADHHAAAARPEPQINAGERSTHTSSATAQLRRIRSRTDARTRTAPTIQPVLDPCVRRLILSKMAGAAPATGAQQAA